SSLRVKVASTSDARSSSNVGNTTAALNKSRHLSRVEISGPFYNKTRYAIESLQAAEEEGCRVEQFSNAVLTVGHAVKINSQQNGMIFAAIFAMNKNVVCRHEIPLVWDNRT
ncbi:MAG TPA: hypothetical protein VH558_17870, partial [Pseudolabrys sp.]